MLIFCYFAPLSVHSLSLSWKKSLPLSPCQSPPALPTTAVSQLLFIVPSSSPGPAEPHAIWLLPVSPTSHFFPSPLTLFSILVIRLSSHSHPKQTSHQQGHKTVLILNSQSLFGHASPSTVVLPGHLGRPASLGLPNTFLSWVSFHLCGCSSPLSCTS